MSEYKIFKDDKLIETNMANLQKIINHIKEKQSIKSLPDIKKELADNTILKEQKEIDKSIKEYDMRNFNYDREI